MLIALTLMMAAGQHSPAALPAPTPELCRQASESIENKVGFLLRQPTVISAGMDRRAIDQAARIEAFRMIGRPIADSMAARFHPRPSAEQGTPDPAIANMDFDQLFSFSKTCLEMPET